jgi:hypothetical protein
VAAGKCDGLLRLEQRAELARGTLPADVNPRLLLSATKFPAGGTHEI